MNETTDKPKRKKLLVAISAIVLSIAVLLIFYTVTAIIQGVTLLKNPASVETPKDPFIVFFAALAYVFMNFFRKVLGVICLIAGAGLLAIAGAHVYFGTVLIKQSDEKTMRLVLILSLVFSAVVCIALIRTLIKLLMLGATDCKDLILYVLLPLILSVVCIVLNSVALKNMTRNAEKNKTQK